MTYDYHAVLGILAIALGFVGYFLYFRSMFRGETKAHPFTWLIIAFIDAIVFIALVIKGAGPGAWPIGVSVVACTFIAFVAFRTGEKNITRSDWVCLIGACLAMVLWIITDDPFGAIVILVIVNFVAAIPTYRKSFIRPFEESLSIWTMDAIRYAILLAALQSFTWTTALFPAGVVVTDSLLIAMILLRRRQLAKRG